MQIGLTLRACAGISSLAANRELGGDRHGTRPQVFLTHCAVPRRTSDLGTLATVDHHRRRAGPPGEDDPPTGRGVLPIRRGAGRWASNGPWSATGPSAFSPSVWTGSQTPLAAGPRAVFPPEVAIHVVRLACERPDLLGRSLSQWDCAELARQLIAEGIVEDISAATVRRILAAHQLKPWRHHLWLLSQAPAGRRLLCHRRRAD